MGMSTDDRKLAMSWQLLNLGDEWGWGGVSYMFMLLIFQSIKF